jgi:hypothetical protein
MHFHGWTSTGTSVAAPPVTVMLVVFNEDDFRMSHHDDVPVINLLAELMANEDGRPAAV